MSEITPNELVENITLTVDDAEVIPVPVDPTLSVQGEAADAKATGDAIAAVFTGATVNGKSFVNKAVTVYAGDILMSNETGAQTVKATIEAITDKDASQIMYDTVNLVSVKSAIDGIKTEIDTELSTDAIDDIFAEVFSDEESE
jgi:hypothetical protein